MNSTSNLTSFGVQKLVEYAEAGLPVLFAGGVPSSYNGYNVSGALSASDNIQQLTSLSNVHIVSSSGLAQSLQSLNIIPRASVSSNGTWYTTWREDEANSTTYSYIFNDAIGLPEGEGYTTGNITFRTTGTPYLYDAWSGSTTPISIYSQTNTTTTIPLELAGNQTIIVGFQNTTSSQLHLQKTIPGVLTATGSDDSVTVYRSFDTETRSAALSNGESASLEPMLTPAFTLSNWTLVVESWTAPSDLYDVTSGATKENTTFSVPTLEPWTAISSTLTNVSGLGYYSASFTWPPSGGANTSAVSGAVIDLGPIKHTGRVSVNGAALPALDLVAARADVGPLLRSGANTVEVVVSTQLGNVLRNYWGEIETSGKLASAVVADPPAEVEYGLVHPVRIIPYRMDELR